MAGVDYIWLTFSQIIINKLGIPITKSYSHRQAGIDNDRLIMIGRQTHEEICLLKEKSCKGIRFDPDVPKSSSDSGEGNNWLLGRRPQYHCCEMPQAEIGATGMTEH